MTYRSLFIEQYEACEGAIAPYIPGQDQHVFGRLDDAAGTLWSFAKLNDLQSDYVDNCWMRVAVNAAGLRSFLQFAQPLVPHPKNLLSLVDEAKWYVINDEEF